MKNKKAIKKILITGFFGVNNLGDDIMLDVFCKAVIATCNSKITILNLYGDRKNYNLPDGIDVLDISIFKHGKTIIVAEFLSRIFDALFWIGGTCFTENAGNGIYPYMKSFYNRGKIFGYIGVGIGNVESKRKIDMYSWLFNNASLVTFRDKESYKTAMEWSSNPQMFLCDDLVYLLDNEPDKNIKSDSDGYLLISWRSYKGYYENTIEEKAIDELCKYVVLQKNQYSHIYVSILGNDVDIERNRQIYLQLSKYLEVTFLRDISTSKKIELIKGAKTVITGRLHGVFLSEMNRINTIAIGYDNKLERFMESINATSDLIYPQDMTVESITRAARNSVDLSDNTIANKKNDALRNVELFCDLVK